jgi:N-acetylneuraminate synthase
MVPIFGNEKVEISCHYGIENFFQYGALIIDKVNREYCKKLIIMFPNQQHPTHRHIKKEEAFELLSGDCKLVLNGKEINLKKGKPVLIPREVKHSFSTNNGCIVEEISTTHYVGDSIYDDFVINSLKTSERKVKISLKEDTE